MKQEITLTTATVYRKGDSIYLINYDSDTIIDNEEIYITGWNHTAGHSLIACNYIMKSAVVRDPKVIDHIIHEYISDYGIKYLFVTNNRSVYGKRG
jgi:hypothetical protein